jgi:RNA polymerase sigma-70 factor (ECF subfamily)
VIGGAAAVARQALSGLTTALRVADLRPTLVNGAAGVLVTLRGRPMTVMGFTISAGKIAEIDAIADAERVRKAAAAVLDNE